MPTGRGNAAGKCGGVVTCLAAGSHDVSDASEDAPDSASSAHIGRRSLTQSGYDARTTGMEYYDEGCWANPSPKTVNPNPNRNPDPKTMAKS
mmetsp:Transcript_24685/g.77396  ORF Transcript_24685/g.77396 Transcript_24685/m.77396 type:complete len:92 (+) Transcript_24685:377-652(+)